jgi:hypothetical protein
MEQILHRVLVYATILSIVILLISLSYFLVNIIKTKRVELKLKEYEINISSKVEEDLFGLLDKIIQECFTEYTILNIEYRDDIKYIDANMEKIITQDVAHKVVDRISPILVAKISQIYNINNFEELLSERVYLAVLSYSLQKNNLKTEEK